MARPLRIEFPDAVYHVTSRGDRREPIYRDDRDRCIHLGIIASGMHRFHARAFAYCLMGNHFYLVLQTRHPNLARLMRHINGVYTQAFNRRHRVAGHLLQGRYSAILVDRDSYLLSVVRYVERNPIAVGLVRDAGTWRWSSYAAHVGLEPAPSWLELDEVLVATLGHPLETEASRHDAMRRYVDYVQPRAMSGPATTTLWSTALRQQIYLGDESFVARMQRMVVLPAASVARIPKAQGAGSSDRTPDAAKSGGHRRTVRCAGNGAAAEPAKRET